MTAEVRGVVFPEVGEGGGRIKKEGAEAPSQVPATFGYEVTLVE